jgi:hypothetical protein
VSLNSEKPVPSAGFFCFTGYEIARFSTLTPAKSSAPAVHA